MSAPARLLGLRLQGFKSFAERTHVEFGPGISAVVGPNGSGKSNLADALRWALGEQGRSLRIRRSEDVIFAGSERRAALGMADVTLVLDNADGLLPVEYSVLELGRRLYRSGENDYLLNRQRVRLRDLVDLLDAANLADNAFLFIGQGMVDQALALRPEERRPLFEEVAGVRRHERRRRRSEEQLAEAEANLARVEDILGELRPQARRLAAQAEVQVDRVGAGGELATALVEAAHARWHGASTRVAAATTDRERAAGEADQAMRALAAAEALAGSITADLGARAAVEIERRERHESRQAALMALQLREARLTSELGSIRRDRDRAEAERSAAEAELIQRRRALAIPIPGRDLQAEAELGEAERALGDALAELGALRAARQARGEEVAALRRAEAARHADAETARRRSAEAERRAAEEASALEVARRLRSGREAVAASARRALDEASASEASTAAARESARTETESVEATRQAALERASRAAEAQAELEGRIAELRARLAEDETRGIARAARRRGGLRLDEDLQVEPSLRAAVEAALGDAVRGYLVSAGAVPDLASERGTVIVGERLTERSRPGGDRERAPRERALALGGGSLVNAVRRDPRGAAIRLLERAVWLPDLAAAMAMQQDLPPGWIAVPRDGSAVVRPLDVSLGRPDTTLERRAELEGLANRAAREAAQLDELRVEAESAADRAARARESLASAHAAEAEALAERRRAEDVERVAARELESAVREVAWHEAQSTRLSADAARAREALLMLEPGRATVSASAEGSGPGVADEAVAAWERRAEESRARRDRLAAVVGDLEATRRSAEAGRARAEAGVALGEERMARAVADLESLSTSERGVAAELETLASELTIAEEREVESRRAVDQLRDADTADRERLAATETEAAGCRDRLRAADERVRAADVAELEARLALDAIREGLLVELAGLGEAGLGPLAAAASTAATPPGDDTDEAARLEGLLDTVTARWADLPPAGDAPSSARLAVLRRRFHELGAPNPFAVEEYAALRQRLESLEAQQRDLREAIATTRRLIAELDTLIADQFRATFRALESAFDRRFQQLFGGGFARLSLTEPADLAATGVEIVARPPGKRAQPLALLSGGERALTAVALLFAMLEVRPVPFCVLDEVDAALDEANVGRFADALRELATRTQCIIITHNRGTIESADALYGVTVGDDSVSRVISLRLEEAQAIADGARDADAIAAG